MKTRSDKGKKIPPERRAVIVKNLTSYGDQSGDKNLSWKGDLVSLDGLHKWVRSNMPAQKCCEQCGGGKRLDLSNKTGAYNRDFKNWWYLCRKCHVQFDNSHKKQWETRREKGILNIKDPKTGRFVKKGGNIYGI